MMGSEDYSAAEAEPCSWTDPLRYKKRKRRFSEDQIKSLESMFDSHTKLDPMKKLQLAKELGLQPRQVAIWFQNKRARWKSKQLEREYGTLRAEYDALLSSIESLKKENQILTKQLQILAELLVESPEEGRKSGHPNDEGKEEQRPSASVQEKSNLTVTMYPGGKDKKFSSNFSEEEAELYRGQPAGDFSTSAEHQFSFQPSWPSYQPSDSSQWWEF